MRVVRSAAGGDDPPDEESKAPSQAGGAKAPELSVAQLTRLVRERVEAAPELKDIWVRGEASNVRLAQSGHLYFTLKDEQAQIRVAYFAFARGSRKPPADGLAYLVHGSVRVYERQGEYQLLADDLLPAGKGDLAARFEALKRRLHEEGLFDESRKLPLPAYPRCIGIVTGMATAALQDMLNVLRRRAPYLHVILFPASVQGEAAPAEIIAALKHAEAHPEVELVILARGGGSMEDLWCFNDEPLARCIAGLQTPVLSGVGHEIDFTIADFAADLRAPTPSAAAELCAPDAGELRVRCMQLGQRAHRAMHMLVSTQRDQLGRLFDRRILRDIKDQVESLAVSTDRLGAGLASSMGRVLVGATPAVLRGQPAFERLTAATRLRLREADSKAGSARSAILANLVHYAVARSARSAALLSRLLGLDPRTPLKLGFALVWKDGPTGPVLVRSTEEVALDQLVQVELQDGAFGARRIASEGK